MFFSGKQWYDGHSFSPCRKYMGPALVRELEIMLSNHHVVSVNNWKLSKWDSSNVIFIFLLDISQCWLMLILTSWPYVFSLPYYILTNFVSVLSKEVYIQFYLKIELLLLEWVRSWGGFKAGWKCSTPPPSFLKWRSSGLWMCGGGHLSSRDFSNQKNHMVLIQHLQGAAWRLVGHKGEGTSAAWCFCSASCWQLCIGDALKLFFSGTFP